MDNGESGCLAAVVSPVERGLSVGPDSATVHLLLTEEKFALEKIPKPLLATKGNAQLVRQLKNLSNKYSDI
jgi:hypothetical protein